MPHVNIINALHDMSFFLIFRLHLMLWSSIAKKNNVKRLRRHHYYYVDITLYNNNDKSALKDVTGMHFHLTD